MTDVRDLPTDSEDENGCYMCKYAYSCYIVGKCVIGGPYLEDEEKDDI